MTELISCNVLGKVPAKGMNYPSRPSISGNGDRVAFASEADDLVPGDTNQAEDVFLRIRSEGTTRRISLTPTGQEVPEDSIAPCLSQDGRHLAFISRSPSLRGGQDADEHYTLYVKDLETGQLDRIDADPEGRAFDWSNYPRLSADGQVVLFEASYADDPDSRVLLLLNREKNAVEELDRCSVGAMLNEVTLGPDGRHLAVGTSDPLTRADTGGWRNIYLVDRDGGPPRLMTHSPRKSSSRAHKGQWAKARGWSDEPVLSGDASVVAFASTADNLVSKDRNHKKDIFATVVATEKTERVSLSEEGQEANQDCYHPSISADGRFVSFLSGATNLTGDPVDGEKTNLFVRDRDLGRTYLANRDENGHPFGNCRGATLSADGRWISYAANIDPDGPEDQWPEQAYVVPNPAHPANQARQLKAELDAAGGQGQIVRLQGAILVGGIRLGVRGG